jgi:hypothetical protein
VRRVRVIYDAPKNSLDAFHELTFSLTLSLNP